MVVAEQANPRNWAVVTLKVLPRVMVDSETVHLMPMHRIRGRDTGVHSARDTGEVEKIQRNDI